MRHLMIVVLTLIVLQIPVAACADPGDTVAVRRFGDDTVRIETMWGLRVVITSPETAFANSMPPAMIGGVDLLIRHERPDGFSGDRTTAYALEDGQPLDVVIDRVANSSRVSVVYGAGDFMTLSPNSLRVRWFGDGSSNGYYLVEVDGVKIVYALTMIQEQIGEADVFLASAALGKGIQSVAARYFVPMDAGTQTPVNGRKTVSNTLAVSMSESVRDGQNAETVLLKPKPWTMPSELVSLFEKKEALAAESMAVFTPMSADQMNHKPSNGTHTPRWNVEHMTGVELGFFSSVYNKRDSEVTAIRRFPKQMPPDYVARYPTWTGAEEARQIERTQAHSRRFAYLLDGLPLDELPEGAPRFVQSLEGLFATMGRHYPEHTGHVIEKTKQADWPND